MKNKSVSLMGIIAVILCAVPELAYGNNESVEGIWLGNMKAMGSDYGIIFRISRNSDGTLIVTIDFPDQNLNNIPVEKVTLDDDALVLDVKFMNAAFDGKIAKEGTTIKGDWGKGGFTFPIVLNRVSEAEVNKYLEAKSHKKFLKPNELKEDLDFLFKTLEEVHPNVYAYINRSDFEKYKKQLYENTSESKNKVDFYKLVAPVICQLRFGHCNLIPPKFQEFKRRGVSLPLSFELSGQDLIVVKNFTDKDIPKNSKIIKINNQPTNDLIDRYSLYKASESKVGDSRWAVKALTFLRWLENDYIDSYLIEIEKPDGLKAQVNVKLIARQEIETLKAEKEFPDDSKFSYDYKPDYMTVIIDIDTFAPQFQEDLEGFLKESFKKIQEQQPLALIIDIRSNGGGDSHLGDLLLDYITDKPFRQIEKYDLKLSKQLIDLQLEMSTEKPDDDDLAAVYSKVGSLTTQHISLKTHRKNRLRFDGSIFVLTDYFTFSSAQSFASAIKCFGIATIIGEETSGTTTEYGEIMIFTMPNSGLMFSSPCKYFTEACGKQDGRGVIPDYEIKQKVEDTAQGVDTVLQFTLDLIKKQNINSVRHHICTEFLKRS